MELLIENLNIVETSLYTERLPSRSRCHSDDRRQSRHSDDRRQSRILVSILGTADNYSKLIFNLNFIMCRLNVCRVHVKQVSIPSHVIVFLLNTIVVHEHYCITYQTNHHSSNV